MIGTETMLLITILAAGFYLAWNIGANDVANAMGTSVGSGALTLKRAIIIAAILEFAGAYFFGSHVSETVQNGIVKSGIFTENPMILVYGMLSSLLATGAWLQVASYYGWPVSTTHSIVGAIVGFGAVVGGMDAIYWDNILYIVGSWILSPIFGGIFSYFIFTILRKKIFYTRHPVESAKKLTPYILFVVISMLTLLLLYKGLNNLHLDFNFLQASLISCLFGGIGALFGYFAVRQIETTPIEIEQEPIYDRDVLESLNKAQKHLQKVRLATTGELQYEVSSLANELKDLTKMVKVHTDGDNASDYSVVEKIFGYLQIISACIMAFAHGANDVANAIGPLAACLSILSTGMIVADTTIPGWLLAFGGLGIVIGLATWGWRVIMTIGKNITELTPTRGFSAEFGAAATILIASRLGLPISTTHTLVGSVIGVGFARGIGALNLDTTRDILISWIVTVPAGALLSIVFFYGIEKIFA